jgi:two-component system alkaline phosphatase synthesis response regulator PhoP
METNPIKILIADDEPDIIEIISFHLNKAGYEVVSAKDGVKPLKKQNNLIQTASFWM